MNYINPKDVILKDYDLLIVGSGLFGLTIARRAAQELNLHVLIIEKRNHPGGNAWSSLDVATGIEVHKYGSHLFHTSNKKVWEFANQISPFRGYRHTVYAKIKEEVYELPINLTTINQFFGKNFAPTEASNFLREMAYSESKPLNFEDKVMSVVGFELYEAFYKGYTIKQWGTDPKLLPAEMASRLPIRTTRNNRYFNDKYEGLPSNGYFEFLSNIATDPRIQILLNTDYFEIKGNLNPDLLTVYTGPVDRYFNYSHGKLGWRTLDFQTELLDVMDYQGAAVMNYPEVEIPFTRIHEYKHLAPEKQDLSSKTIISKEFSRFAESEDEPYYPINTELDRKIYEIYRDETRKETNIVFGGRLGTYKYLDMDMAIASAFVAFENKIRPRFSNE